MLWNSQKPEWKSCCFVFLKCIFSFRSMLASGFLRIVVVFCQKTVKNEFCRGTNGSKKTLQKWQKSDHFWHRRLMNLNKYLLICQKLEILSFIISFYFWGQWISGEIFITIGNPIVNTLGFSFCIENAENIPRNALSQNVKWKMRKDQISCFGYTIFPGVKVISWS